MGKRCVLLLMPLLFTACDNNLMIRALLSRLLQGTKREPLAIPTLSFVAQQHP